MEITNLKIEYLTRKYGMGFPVTIHVSLTEDGWRFKHQSSGSSMYKNDAPNGEPGLTDCLDQHGISYPKDLGKFMARLWLMSHSQKLSKSDVQGELDKISRWINDTEISTPTKGIFEGFSEDFRD